MVLDECDPDTAGIMEYCLWFCLVVKSQIIGKHSQEVEYEMWLNQYTGGPGVEYMSRVDDAFNILANKFKYAPKWEEFQSRYYGY